MVVTNIGINGTQVDQVLSPTSDFNTFGPRGLKRINRLLDGHLWRGSLDPHSYQDGYASTDGAVPGFVFATLTGSMASSTRSGYEGLVNSTTGGSSGNTNSWIGYDAGLGVTNRVFWIAQSLYLPAVTTTTLYDLWLGWFNKQATPGATAPTDGAYMTLINNGVNGLTLQGFVANNSNATGTTNTVNILAATSFEWGVVLQPGNGADFWYRLPATAPTFAATDDWTFLGSVTTSPRSSVLLRPTMAHITRYAATHAIDMESAMWGMQEQLLR